MAEKLTKDKIEEIAKNYEKIIEGKVPVIKGQKETVTEKIDPKILQEKKKILKMIPPSDPRLLMQIAPFVDDTLKEARRRCFEGAGKRVIDVSENSDNGVVTAREGDQCAAEAYVKMLSGDGKQKKKMYYL